MMQPRAPCIDRCLAFPFPLHWQTQPHTHRDGDTHTHTHSHTHASTHAQTRTNTHTETQIHTGDHRGTDTHTHIICRCTHTHTYCGTPPTPPASQPPTCLPARPFTETWALSLDSVWGWETGPRKKFDFSYWQCFSQLCCALDGPVAFSLKSSNTKGFSLFSGKIY